MGYQCTGIDNCCIIEANITVILLSYLQYRINDKPFNKILYSGTVSLTQDVQEKSLYVGEVAKIKVCIEGF